MAEDDIVLFWWSFHFKIDVTVNVVLLLAISVWDLPLFLIFISAKKNRNNYAPNLIFKILTCKNLLKIKFVFVDKQPCEPGEVFAKVHGTRLRVPHPPRPPQQECVTWLIFMVLLLLVVLNVALYYKLWMLEEAPPYTLLDLHILK